MEKNVGRLDSIIRTISGFAVMGAGRMYQSWRGLPGAAVMIPAMMASGPVYSLVRININNR